MGGESQCLLIDSVTFHVLYNFVDIGKIQCRCVAYMAVCRLKKGAPVSIVTG